MNIPDTRRAVVVTEHGGPEVLQVQDVELVAPGPGQLLIEVAASGVNFIDVYKRQGVYPTHPPYVAGGECAGRVLAVGDGVDGFGVGDVVASASADGTHATHALLDAATAVTVPGSVAPDIAAAVMLQGMTAHYLVRSTYPVGAGDRVLVHAGAGGVGALLIQLARSAGASVVTTVGSAAKADIAQAAGADTVLRYDEIGTGDELAAAVKDASDGGVHVVYDGVGRSTFEASLASLRRRGMLVLFGGSSGQVPPFDLQRLNAAGSLFVTRPTLAHYIATRSELTGRAGDLFAAIGAGTLDVAVGGRYDLEHAADAYRDLEGRHSTGKLLIVP